jgi:two-component system OmpR family response regulator
MTADATPRIFVVDDDVFVAHAVTLALRYAGYAVSTFTDALSAAQQARLSAPDVVITDYSMPQFNGLVFAAWLQENCPACGVVILTGQAEAVEEQAFAGLRFTLLEKPVSSRILIEVVQRQGQLCANRKS